DACRLGMSATLGERGAEIGEGHVLETDSDGRPLLSERLTRCVEDYASLHGTDTRRANRERRGGALISRGEAGDASVEVAMHRVWTQSMSNRSMYGRLTMSKKSSSRIIFQTGPRRSRSRKRSKARDS